MWMKEETMGVEDSFRLTHKVMMVFARQEMNEEDSQVERYLLNFWSKELSVRDLCDRIALTIQDLSEEETDLENASKH